MLMGNKVIETSIGKRWDRYTAVNHEAPESLIVTQEEFAEFVDACLASGRAVEGFSTLKKQVRYYGTLIRMEGGDPYTWDMVYPYCPACNQHTCKCSGPITKEQIKLTTLIKVWDELKLRSDPLGYCDLEGALEANGVTVINDTER
jgi:hypothetical protein